MDIQKITMDSKRQPKESKRQCRHSHGRRKHSVEEPVSPPSPVIEEASTVDVDILKLDDRPATSSSEKKSALFSVSPRPASRRLDSRPSSTRSTFEHIPGTRPASRRVSLNFVLFFSSNESC